MKRAQAPDGITDYVYDARNRMVELRNSAGTARYGYAHDGTRLSQTTGVGTASAVTTQYLVDPNQAYAQVIEERTQSGAGIATLSALYTFGDDRIRQFRTAQAASGSTAALPASLRYYHADGLGSTRLLSDDAGTVMDRYAYEAFGEVAVAAAQATTPNNFLFTGEQRDPNSGLYYLRTRYLDPSNARFTQHDTFAGQSSDPITLHKYLYANAAPTQYVDPSGRVAAAVCELALGIDLQDILQVSSSQGARVAFRNALFGHPPRDFGIVGEWVIDYIINSVALTLIDVGGAAKQPSFGTDAHLDLEDKLEEDFKRFKRRAEKKGFILDGVEIRSEVFRDRDGTPASRRGKGTVGIDIVMY